MIEDSAQLISQVKKAYSHGVCGAAGAVQRKRLQRYLYLNHHVINLKEKKNIKNKDIN